MKRTLSLLLAIIMVFSLLPVTTFAAEVESGGKISFTTTFTEGMNIGDTFTVTATLSENPGLASYASQFKWNDEVVEFTGFSKKTNGKPVTEVFAEDCTNVVNDATGYFTSATDYGNTTNGILCIGEFKIIASGELGLGLTDTDVTLGQFVFADETGKDYQPTFDFSAIEGLSVAGSGEEEETTISVIPEGANFLDMYNQNNAPVIITKMDDHYKVEVPQDTTDVYVVYNEGDIAVDNFGYASVFVDGVDEVSDDAYGQVTENGKITVDFSMVKAAANGGNTIDLINLQYETARKTVTTKKTDSTWLDTFAFTYQLGEGEHFAILPKGFGYYVSGSSVASDGYTFTVTLGDDYEATADFAIKVNGETFATAPGDVTVESVTEDLIITVEGVAKIVEDTDIVLTMDLTNCTAAISGFISYLNTSNQTNNQTLELGEVNTLSLPAAENTMIYLQLSGFSALVTGWEIDGTVYNVPTSYTKISLDNGSTLYMDKTYFNLENKGKTPITMVVKPILAEAESVGAAPAFVEDCIAVTDISIVGAEVDSYAWEGDTLNVVLAEGTATDAALKTLWTITAENTTEGAEESEFEFNGEWMGPGVKGSVEGAVSVTLADGIGTATAAFTMCTCDDPTWDLTFTPKTYTVNFTIASGESEQPESNPITKIEVSHPSIKTDDNGNMTMAMVAGASETIDVSFAVADAELDPTEIVFWSSAVESVATVDQTGKITAKAAGTTTIIAKAVDPNAGAMLVDGEEVLASITLTVSEPAKGYTVTMGEDKEVVANETIQIPVTVTHSDSTVTGYKSYEFTFQYDPALLTLNNKSAENDEKDVTIVDNNGTVTVRRYGAELKVGEAAITLEFTANTTCETNVTLTGAKVGTSEDAQGQNIPDAQIVDNVTLITVSGYTVTLPDALDGETVVAPGAEYTFEAKDKNYEYTVKATIDGSEIAVTNNGDGTFTIAEDVINGNVNIEVVSETGKKFDVTITEKADMAPAEGFTVGEDAAQYMVDYKAVLTPAEGYEYSVKITINNKEYACTPDDSNVYTIAGSAITGNISIEVTKTEVSVADHNVSFSGTGVEDLVEGYATKVAHNGTYTFSLMEAETYAYTVTASMGGTAVTPVRAETANEDGSFTYTIENVTADLTIQIEKSDLTVEVNEYVTLNDKTVFLVTATQTLPEGKTLAYGGTAMYLKNFQVESETVQQYAYLVMVDSNTLTVEEATAQVTAVEATSTVLEDTCNVNESSALDINDAQLVYDLYNNVYQEITTVGMQKFLRADVNGSKNINVSDAAAVVNAILAAK